MIYDTFKPNILYKIKKINFFIKKMRFLQISIDSFCKSSSMNVKYRDRPKTNCKRKLERIDKQRAKGESVTKSRC